ncbi:MAG: transposase [Muribaculaceae bacterium]|nr:transposase [Muribaculaceae bacterium]
MGKKPSRKSPRAQFHDYSGGDYFITICTYNGYHYFGKVSDEKMTYTKIGEIAREKLESLDMHYKYAKLITSVVMPNHIHAIIRIAEPSDAPGCVPTTRTALSVVVGGYKQAVTLFARRNNIDFAWQSRYHDHIIRNQYDANKISNYIENNIANWDKDCFNNPSPSRPN